MKGAAFYMFSGFSIFIPFFLGRLSMAVVTNLTMQAFKTPSGDDRRHDQRGYGVSPPSA